MSKPTDYSAWSNADLIKRVTDLERQLKRRIAPEPPAPKSPGSSAATPKKPSKPHKPFDPSRYSTRLIALKFAYLGRGYNGYEHHANNVTPLPTIEEELWKALRKTRLIFPTDKEGNVLSEGDESVSWEGCEYSKCGRTDRGVSAFGQVVGIRVRSDRPKMKNGDGASIDMEDAHVVSANDFTEAPQADASDPSDVATAREAARSEDVVTDGSGSEAAFDPIRQELPYIQLLNRVLPPEIRILAWCPNPPRNFSARFSCKERRYKYFFTQPAFAPVPGVNGIVRSVDGKEIREGWLDIEAMREAAKKLQGQHDFRNFCKVDPAKQITNFERRIFHADVEEVDPRTAPVGFVGHPELHCGLGFPLASNGMHSSSHEAQTPRLYTVTLHGSAFLWHQVRHIVAILFLVGQGLESPSIVSDLLDVSKNPTKPKYEMASDIPLVLWDCVFPAEGSDTQEDGLAWVYVGDGGGRENSTKADADSAYGKYGKGGIIDDLWEVWRRRKMDEILAGGLLDVVARQGRKTFSEPRSTTKTRSARVFDGGDAPRSVGPYVPVLKKQRMESVEVINARYAQRKGLDLRDADFRAQIDVEE
ncbi:pseudouridine synthase deg1 [Elasticomyces elasticus]|nr:pseudouridine synthase deg1 [Elasticomyces elasticus]